MSFLHPAGLWLLLGIPVLILIYILTSRHEERGVSSTYIWKLSDRYVKKRFFSQSFKRILLLILQILAIAAAAFFIARPTVTRLPKTDYILVFDCSASMQIKDDEGVTRFERAKNEAMDMLGELNEGHRFSVIAASDDPAVLLRYSGSKEELELCVGALRPLYGGYSLEKTFELINGISSETSDPRVIFFTDRPAADSETGRVEVRDLSAGEKNLTALRLRAVDVPGGKEFHGYIRSEGYTGEVTAALKIDGEIVDAVKAALTDGEQTEIVFGEKVRHYQRAELFLSANDRLAEDDSYILCAPITRSRSVLLVSNSPLYLRTALRTVEGVKLTSMSTAGEGALSGRDLYIFDGVVPEKVPNDGSMIFFGVECEEINLLLGEERTEENVVTRAQQSDAQIGEGFDASDEATVVGGYRVLDTGALWETVLVCGGEPVAAIRSLDNGRRAVAFSFDLHDTNLPLQAKYIRLIGNLLNYTVPPLIEKNEYSYGEKVTISAQGSSSAYAETPAGGLRIIDLSDSVGTFIPDDLGVYSVSVQSGQGEENEAEFYLHIPPAESDRAPVSDIPEVFVPEGTEQVREATREITFWIVVAMMVLLMLEWGLYIYEQY